MCSYKQEAYLSKLSHVLMQSFFLANVEAHTGLIGRCIRVEASTSGRVIIFLCF